MLRLKSYLQDRWQDGAGAGATLHNPATEEALATTSTEGLDLGAAVAHARDVGGPALRALTFAERGACLKALAAAVQEAREELVELSTANNGATRGDAKFDVDGAAFTLAAYAELGQALGEARTLVDGDSIQLGRSPRWSGQHLLTSREGVAVHVNAFNFPAWGLAEKAAPALLAGVPVVSKPATATALVSYALMGRMVATGALPPGALSLVCGGAGDLLQHLTGQDVLAFTGGGHTAAVLRALRCVVADSVSVNVEADSLNAAVLGPDVTDRTGVTMGLFLGDVVRDMTQKAGQKCTAVRRILAPADLADDVCALLAERLSAVTVGDPADAQVRMGPLATARQRDDVRAGIERLVTETLAVHGGAGETPHLRRGHFVGPVLRRLARAADLAAAPSIHEREVFGPVATVIPYDGTAEEAAAVVRRGAGGLVASVWSDDRDFTLDLIPRIAAWHGRVYIGSEKVAGMTAGPGTVVPQLVHGGPGRAGGGEELGGVRGMLRYMQRTAIQADQATLRALAGRAAPLP